MYVITGATGNTGRKIAELLLKAGKPVRVIGRSEDRLKPLLDKGAEAAVGSMEDEEFLIEAFSGPTAVFSMIPPNLQAKDVREYQSKIGGTTAAAIDKSGVSHVVNLSSLGAPLTHGRLPALNPGHLKNRIQFVKNSQKYIDKPPRNRIQ